MAIYTGMQLSSLHRLLQESGLLTLSVTLSDITIPNM